MKQKLAALVPAIALIAVVPATADDHGAAYWAQMEQFEVQHPPLPARGSWSVNRPTQTNAQGCASSVDQQDFIECEVKNQMAKDTSFPFYPDPTPLCRSAASNSEQFYNNCVKTEQSGYDAANNLWPHMSDHSRAMCLMIADTLDPRLKYGALGSCSMKEYHQYDVPRQAPEPFTR